MRASKHQFGGTKELAYQAFSVIDLENFNMALGCLCIAVTSLLLQTVDSYWIQRDGRDFLRISVQKESIYKHLVDPEDMLLMKILFGPWVTHQTALLA